MCNRVVQNKVVVKPGGKAYVLMKGPGGEFEVPYTEAVFGGPAKRESRGYWISKEGAEDVLVPNVSQFGEKNKTRDEQGWEDVAPGSSLEGLLLPQPPGKDYRLLKIVTQPATPEQIARLGNDRAPIVHPPKPATSESSAVESSAEPVPPKARPAQTELF
jgi:hypothetical protein